MRTPVTALTSCTRRVSIAGDAHGTNRAHLLRRLSEHRARSTSTTMSRHFGTTKPQFATTDGHAETSSRHSPNSKSARGAQGGWVFLQHIILVAKRVEAIRQRVDDTGSPRTKSLCGTYGYSYRRGEVAGATSDSLTALSDSPGVPFDASARTGRSKSYKYILCVNIYLDESVSQTSDGVVACVPEH